LFQLLNNLFVLIIQIYLLYRCNILYNSFSLSIFYQLVRIAPRSSPWGRAGVCRHRRPRRRRRRGSRRRSRRCHDDCLLLPCLPLAPPLVLRRRTVIGQHTLLDAGRLGLGARGRGYLPHSSRKHDDHGALPPCPKSCQNMSRTWDTSAKKISGYSCG